MRGSAPCPRSAGFRGEAHGLSTSGFRRAAPQASFPVRFDFRLCGRQLGRGEKWLAFRIFANPGQFSAGREGRVGEGARRNGTRVTRTWGNTREHPRTSFVVYPSLSLVVSSMAFRRSGPENRPSPDRTPSRASTGYPLLRLCPDPLMVSNPSVAPAHRTHPVIRIDLLGLHMRTASQQGRGGTVRRPAVPALRGNGGEVSAEHAG